MKKLFVYFLVVSLLTLSFGCETREEKEARRAREEAEILREQYYQSLEEYNDLKKDMFDYFNNQNRLGD